MSEEDISVIATVETARNNTKTVKVDDETKHWKNTYSKRTKKDGEKQKKTLLRRLPSIESALIPFGRFRNSFRKLNCFKIQEDDEVPMIDMSRHKSIDISVGLARRVSLFLFTKKTVCAHPYHPYTPEQTTRKIYVFTEDK